MTTNNSPSDICFVFEHGTKCANFTTYGSIGGAGGDSYDQGLNTTANVTFDNVNITHNLNVYANSSFNGSLMPMKTLTYDIGSGVLRWRNIYGVNLSIDYIEVLQEIFSSGNITTSEYFIGDGSFLTNLNLSGDFLNLSGTNANQNVNITPWNFTASTIFGADIILNNTGCIDFGSRTTSICESATNDMDIKSDGRIDVWTDGEISFRVSNDINDYFIFKTIVDVPTLNTTGDSNLRLVSSSGTIDFSNENLTTTGNITTDNLNVGNNLNVSQNATVNGIMFVNDSLVIGTNLPTLNAQVTIKNNYGVALMAFDSLSSFSMLKFLRGGGERWALYNGGSDDFYIREDGSGVRVIIKEGGEFQILNNLNVSGNITGNQIYGGMYNHSHSPTEMTFVQYENYTLPMEESSSLNGFEHDFVSGVGSNLTTLVSGKYQAHIKSIGDGQNNHIYVLGLFVNDVSIDQCDAHKKMSAGGDITTMSSFCFVDLIVGDVVDVRISDWTLGGGTGNYYGGNLNLVRVGD